MRKLVLLLVTFVSFCVFIGLAALGWGGFRAFFSQPPFVALTIVTFALGLAAALTPVNLSSGEREDRGNRWVLPVFGVLGLLQAWLPAYTDQLGYLTFGGTAVRWIGVVIYTLGGVLRIWPLFVLGRRFSGLVGAPIATLIGGVAATVVVAATAVLVPTFRKFDRLSPAVEKRVEPQAADEVAAGQ